MWPGEKVGVYDSNNLSTLYNIACRRKQIGPFILNTLFTGSQPVNKLYKY